MKKVLLTGPILTRSGYGEMARLAYRALKSKPEQYEIYLMSTNWGANGSFSLNCPEMHEIYECMKKTEALMKEKDKSKFDISVQVTIPNEWKNLATVNVGYTAGIETNVISPAWFEPSGVS